MPSYVAKTGYMQMRQAISTDLGRLVEIEAECVDGYEPWDKKDFRWALRQQHLIVNIGEVYTSKGFFLSGFIIVELNGLGYVVWNICVDPGMRRLGVGGGMIENLQKSLKANVRDQITASVRDSNLTGQLFFRDKGFKAVKVQRKFFRDGSDAYLFRYPPPKEVERGTERPDRRDNR